MIWLLDLVGVFVVCWRVWYDGCQRSVSGGQTGFFLNLTRSRWCLSHDISSIAGVGSSIYQLHPHSPVAVFPETVRQPLPLALHRICNCTLLSPVTHRTLMVGRWRATNVSIFCQSIGGCGHGNVVATPRTGAGEAGMGNFGKVAGGWGAVLLWIGGLAEDEPGGFILGAWGQRVRQPEPCGLAVALAPDQPRGQG